MPVRVSICMNTAQSVRMASARSGWRPVALAAAEAFKKFDGGF